MNKDKDKFSKEIKKTLEDAPYFEPTDQMMADMELRLDAHHQEPQSRRVAWWWLLLIPLFTLPFLFSTVYFYKKSQNIQEQFDQYTSRQPQLKQITNQETQQQTTILYDTIYQTVYQKEIISEKAKGQLSERNSKASKLNRTPFTYKNANVGRERAVYNLTLLNSISSKLIPELEATNTYRFSDNKVVRLLSPSYSKANIAVAPPSLLSWEKALSTINLSPILPLLATPYGLEEEWYLLPLENLEPHKKTSREKLLSMAPVGLNVGLNALPFFSFGTPGESGFNFAYGAHGEVVFRNNFRLGIGLNKLDVSYKTKQNFSAYPSVSLDNPQDAIKELYINLAYLEVPIYFQYLIGKEKKFHPFVHLGMVARRALKQEFLYELVNNAGEYKRAVQSPTTTFSIPTIQAGIGLEFPVFKNLYASPQLLYKHNFKVPDLEIVKLHALGLDLRLQYHF